MISYFDSDHYDYFEQFTEGKRNARITRIKGRRVYVISAYDDGIPVFCVGAEWKDRNVRCGNKAEARRIARAFVKGGEYGYF